MRPISFSDAEQAGKRKNTRRARLALERVATPEVDQRVLVSQLIAGLQTFMRHIADARTGP